VLPVTISRHAPASRGLPYQRKTLGFYLVKNRSVKKECRNGETAWQRSKGVGGPDSRRPIQHRIDRDPTQPTYPSNRRNRVSRGFWASYLCLSPAGSPFSPGPQLFGRSEERRVGKE